MSITDVTEANFEKQVLKSNVPVVVDIWAEWCGPCRLYAPIIEEVSKDYEGKVKFFKMNADENQKTLEKYDIMSIPTTLLMENGIVKAMNIGAISKDALRKWLKSNL
jgi:thioredoxin 1